MVVAEGPSVAELRAKIEGSGEHGKPQAGQQGATRVVYELRAMVCDVWDEEVLGPLMAEGPVKKGGPEGHLVAHIKVGLCVCVVVSVVCGGVCVWSMVCVCVQCVQVHCMLMVCLLYMHSLHTHGCIAYAYTTGTTHLLSSPYTPCTITS